MEHHDRPSLARRPLRATGFIFDLDGTLVSNMAVHAEAFARFVERYSLPSLTLEMRARLDGKRNADIFPVLFERALSAEEVGRFEDEKEGLYRRLSVGRLEPLAGLTRLLAALERRGLPAAVATSAPADNVPHTLGELGLAGRLLHVVRSDQVPRGKPYPDVFLAAARLIGVAPERCLAFEDAPAGIRAARAAGMTCVALTTSFSRAEFVAHGAEPDAAVADFEEFLAGSGAWLEATDDGGEHAGEHGNDSAPA
jgi:HAD superfamily hydrolase (TIGR01509 family)